MMQEGYGKINSTLTETYPFQSSNKRVSLTPDEGYPCHITFNMLYLIVEYKTSELFRPEVSSEMNLINLHRKSESRTIKGD